MPGFPELVLVMIILVIVLGYESVPRMGEALGRWFAARAEKLSEDTARGGDQPGELHQSPAEPPEHQDTDLPGRSQDGLPGPTGPPRADMNKRATIEDQEETRT